MNELTAFNAIGYELIAPKPSLMLLFGSTLLVAAIARMRRFGLRKSRQS